MKKIWRKLSVLASAAALSLVLSGCLADSTVEDLFTLPQPPIEYTELSATISSLLAGGYEYASPTAGQNIQSVQMVDLNSDGENEAVAFFRDPTDDKPLKIMLFRAFDGGYELAATIESSGTSIERVEYRDMNGDGMQELVVGWKIGSDVQNVAVYATGAEPTVLMQTNYTHYSIQEMDGDGIPSLMVLRADADGVSVAEFYGWRGEAVTLVYRSPLSSTMAAISSGSVVSGMLDEDTSAVFITGINEEGMAVTDILACRDNGTLTNAAVSQATGVSTMIYPYRQLQPQDLNSDGIIEVPAPAVIAELGKQSDGFVDWLHCNVDGAVERIVTTYHCLSADWYLLVPEEWLGRVSTMATETGMNESQVIFKVEGKSLAAVYAITGENRESRALRGSRSVLRRRTDIVYAGEVADNDMGFNAEQLRGCFRLIVSSWTS